MKQNLRQDFICHREITSVVFQVCKRVGVWISFLVHATVYKDIFSKTKGTILFLRTDYYLQNNWLVANCLHNEQTKKGKVVNPPIFRSYSDFPGLFLIFAVRSSHSFANNMSLLHSALLQLPSSWIIPCFLLQRKCSLYPRAESHITVHIKVTFIDIW